MRALRHAALALALVACEEAPEPPAAPAATAPFDARDAQRWPLAGPVAFDLVWAGEAPTLAWADPEGAIHLARFDALGNLEKKVTVARSRKVEEIALGDSGGQLALAWASRHEDGAVIHALTADAVSLAATEAAALGVSRGGKSGRRGRVAVGAGRGGRLVALTRGDREPCEEGEPTTCTLFGMHPLPPDGSDGPRPRLALPNPCDRGVVGFAVVGRDLHYAVCNDEDQPVTTLFTARSAPSYAQAEDLLEGCDPAGISRLGDELWVTATCGASRAAVRAFGIEVSRTKIALSNTTLACEGEGIVLELGIGGRHRLVAPADGLAPVVPSEIAPLESAAIWTGRALLVARPVARDLELSRYRCIDGSFLRDR